MVPFMRGHIERPWGVIEGHFWEVGGVFWVIVECSVSGRVARGVDLLMMISNVLMISISLVGRL